MMNSDDVKETQSKIINNLNNNTGNNINKKSTENPQNGEDYK